MLSRGQVEHVRTDRNLLAEVDSHCIVKLYYSFQDSEDAAFGMKYLHGKRSSKASQKKNKKNWLWFQTVLLRILFVARPLKLKGKALLLMNHVKKNNRRAAMTEDDKGCAPMLSDQSEDNEFLCREVHSENSESLLCLLMNDFLSLALDPFYGIERDCPSKGISFLLKVQISGLSEKSEFNVIFGSI